MSEWMTSPRRGSFDPQDNVTINVFAASTKEKTSSLSRGGWTSIGAFFNLTTNNSAYTGQVLDNLPAATDLDANDDGVIQAAEFEEGMMSAHGAASDALADKQMPPPIVTFSGRTVQIDQPLGGGVVKLGESVVFQGQGTDPKTGSLTLEELRWDSDLDGLLGTGNTIARNDLSAGTHTITLTGTFADGKTLSSSIVITVGVGGVPQISITSPLGGTFQRGESPVQFSGTATDPEDGDLVGLQSILWISDRDGDIGAGLSFEHSDLSAGVHTITMEVRDSDGNIARATTQITILPGIPQVTISGPSDGTVVEAGQLLSFVGTANDPEDGVLDDGALVWTSSIDGEICLGAGCLRTLSTGIHTITLTATDSDGNASTAQVTVTVNFPSEWSLTGTLQSHTGPFTWDPTISNPGPIELVTEVVDGMIFLTMKSDADVRGKYDPETGDWTATGETVLPGEGTLRETLEGRWETDEDGTLVFRGTLTFDFVPEDGSEAGSATYDVEYRPH